MTITIKKCCDHWEALVNGDKVPYYLPKWWNRTQIFERLDRRFPEAIISIDSEWVEWPPIAE